MYCGQDRQTWGETGLNMICEFQEVMSHLEVHLTNISNYVKHLLNKSLLKVLIDLQRIPLLLVETSV